MTAEIICVGTELLLGNIVNTNAAYLAEKLGVEESWLADKPIKFLTLEEREE